MPSTEIKLAVVCVTQSVLAFLLYQNRVAGHFHPAASDLVVLGLPFLAGFAISAWITYRDSSHRSSLRQIVSTIAIAAGLALISSGVAAFFAFNLLGT